MYLEFTVDLTFAHFKRNGMDQLAVLKALEIIEERLSEVSAQTCEEYHQAPWLKIIGMRNRLVIGYFDVSLECVWETVPRDIPRLISQSESLIPPETE